MKPRRLSAARLSFPLASAIAALLTAQSASAQNHYWDSDGTVAGYGTTTGTWGTNAFWTLTATGGSPHSAVTNLTTAHTANFGTATVNYGNATVGVAAGGVTATSIVFGSGQTTAITLGTTGGGAITLGGSTRSIVSNRTGHIINAPIILTGATTISQGYAGNFDGTLTLNGGMSGTGGVSFNAPNASNNNLQTINLGGASTYTGNTTIGVGNDGNTFTVRSNVVNALPTSTVLTMTANNGGGSGRTTTFDLSGNNQTIAGLAGAAPGALRSIRVTSTAAATLTINGTTSNSFGGTNTDTPTARTTIITGAISLVKGGSGTQTLAGPNTYTGTTTLNQGTLTVGTGGTLGANTGALIVNNNNTGVGTNAILNLATAVDTTKGSLSGTIATPSSGTNTATINTQASRIFTVNQTAAGTYAGAINGAGNFTLGSLSTNTLTLTGRSTLTGNVTVSAGTLAAAINANGNSGTATALGNSSTVGRTISVGTATLRFDSGNVLSTNFSSNAVPAITVTGGTLTNSGTATNNALGNLTLAGGTLSAASGTGNTSGYGVWNLNGTVTSTGTSTISSASSFPITLSANVGNSNITSFDVTSGTLTVSAGLGEITATGDEKISGLTKSGAGTLILSGTNIYTGATTVSAGTLSVNGSLNNSPITLSAGTLTGSGTVGAVTMANSVSAILSNNNGTPGASLTTGAITFNGAATVNTFNSSTSAPIVTTSLVGNGSASQVTINPSAASWIIGTPYHLISYGGGSIGGAGGFGQFVLGAVPNAPARTTPSLSDTGSSIAMTFSGDTPYWVGDGDGKWNLASTSNWKLISGATYTQFLASDAVLFDGNATGTTTVDIDTADVAPSTTTFNNTGNNYILTGSFGISTGILTKDGSGSLTINNSNTYAGGTTLIAGTLVLGNANAIGSSSLTITGGSLDSSAVDLVNAGNNAQAWNSDFAFTGTQSLNLGTGAVTMSANRVLTVNANTLTVGGIIGGDAVSLTKAGAGTLVLTAANTYSGGTIINASSGTLQARKNAAVTNALGSGAVDVGASSTLVLDITKTTNITDTFANTITGAGLLKLQFAAATAGRSITLPNVTGFTGTIQLSSLGTTGDKWSAASLGTVAGSLVVNDGSTIFVSTAPAAFTGGITLNGAGNSEGRGAIRLGATSLGGNISLASSSTINMDNAAAVLTGDISSGAAGTQTLTLGATASTGGTLTGIIGGGTGTIDLATAVGGTYSLTNANTYTGTTTIAASTTLQLGNGTSGNDGTISSTSGVTNNGTLAFNRFGTDTWVNAITGTGAVTKLGAGTQTLSGLSATAANNYSGITSVDNGTLAFTTTSPSLTAGLRFGSAATNTTPGIFDLTTTSATFSGALLVNTNSATANEIKIGAAQSLTFNGNVQIGATTPVTGVNAVSRLNLTGGGTFNVATAEAGTFIVGGSTLTSTSTSQNSTLDLTALSATTVNTSSTGTIRVSAGSTSNVAGYKSTLLLPTPVAADTVATATLTANTIGVGVGSGFNNAAGQINTLQLGTGLTTLNANTINVGTGGRDIGQIIFAGAGGDVIIRAADGTSRATTFAIGAGGGGTATTEPTTNNLVDFSGHDADILVTLLNVGNQPRTGNLISEFKFGAGTGSLASTLDATNVNIGFRTGTSSTTSVLTNRVILSGGSVTFGNVGATGTGVDIGNSTYTGAGAASTIGELNISGGTVTMNNSTSMGAAVRIGTNTSANGGTVTASMNLTGGTTTLTGDIVRGTATGTVTSTLKISGGTLDMGGNDIGSSGAGAITLTAESGELKNVASINGNGGFTKTTGGTLTLTGLNTYTGNTVVSAGTLALADNAQLKFVLGATSGSNNGISDAGTLTLDGDFVIDTSAADSLSSGTWTLVDNSTLSETYTTNFTVVGFTDAGSNKWTKVNGAKLYTFDETTGILTLAPSAGYASWAAINAIDSAANLDKDGDGVNNAVEYVLGGDVNTNDLSKLPQGTISGTDMIFTFQRKVDTIDGSTVVEIEVGTTLAAWPTVYTVGADTAGSTPGVVVTEDSSPGFDTITLTVPMGADPKKFARLNVEVP